MYKKNLSKHRPELGFTLIEVLIVVVLVGLILAIGVGSYSSLIDNTQSQKTTSTLKASIAQARMEAITRGGDVWLCGSDDGATCSNSLNSGWLTFHDIDGDAALTDADTALTWNELDYSGMSIEGQNSSGDATTNFGFNYRGYPTQAVSLTVSGREVDGTVQLYANGRVEIQ